MTSFPIIITGDLDTIATPASKANARKAYGTDARIITRGRLRSRQE